MTRLESECGGIYMGPATRLLIAAAIAVFILCVIWGVEGLGQQGVDNDSGPKALQIYWR